MKRIALIIISLTIITSLKGQGLEIAVYTEPQFAWLSSDDGSVVSNGSIFHLNSGIEFDIFFMENYAVTLGLNLNNQGGRIRYEETVSFMQTDEPLVIAANTEVKHNLQYIGIPLGLKLKTEEMGYTTIYFHGGFSPMFIFKATTSAVNPLLESENIKSGLNTFNMNYFVELGIEYRLAGNTAIIGGFKYSAGFSDVTKNDFANVNLHNAGLHVGLLF